MATLSFARARELLGALTDEIEALEAAQASAAPALPADPVPPVLGDPGPLAWGAKVSGQFRDFVRQMGDDFDVDPSWFMAVMAFETGRTFSPKVKNPGSSATGLIQFMAATAKAMGTTTAALATMTAEKQLEYVWLYFRDRIRERGALSRLSDTYMAVLNPVAIGKPDSFVMWIKGSSAYAVNAGLDANKDHEITKAEAAAKVHALLAEGLRPENIA